MYLYIKYEHIGTPMKLKNTLAFDARAGYLFQFSKFKDSIKVKASLTAVMADNNKFFDSKTDAQGKNAHVVYCIYCPSKILNPGAACFTNITFSLPHMQCKRDEMESKEEISEFWLIEDINNFENIGVSHKVENIKFLVCADCERGPVGWHDLSTFRSYIALSRVKHEKK